MVLEILQVVLLPIVILVVGCRISKSMKQHGKGKTVVAPTIRS